MYQAVTPCAVGPIGPRPAATDSWRTEAPQPRAAAATVIIGALASMAILVPAGLLPTHVLAHGSVGHWDETSTRWLASHRASGLDALTGVLSRSADTMGIIAAALLVAIVVGFLRRWTSLSPSDRRVLRPAPRLRALTVAIIAGRRWAPVPAPAPEEAR